MAKEFVGISVLVLVSLTNAGLIPTIEILQGPSSKTTLTGPDGSAVASAAPGGTVIINDAGLGLLAAAPAILPTGPEILVAGPSGSIATLNTLAGPVVLPATIAVAPAASTDEPDAEATESPADADGETEGPTDDGSYVPDKTEEKFDDGSYKEEK